MNDLLNRISSAKLFNPSIHLFKPSIQHCATSISVICPEHGTTANTMTGFKMGAQFTARRWTKESGIVIACRKYEDTQIVRDCIVNARTIEKYVRDAQLWPHEEKFGKVQAPRDVKF
jgi:hypothetical protein